MIKIFTPIVFFLFFTNLFGQSADSSLRITHLKGNFYIYTTFNLYKESAVPANGLYVVTSKGVILLDTPWDTTQFQPLLDSIQTRHNKEVIICIATHFHDDRTAGLAYYQQKGINTYTTRQTDELSKARAKKRAGHVIDQDSLFTIGQYSFQTYFPGHGHTADNIIIWFEKEKILYGGCLVKSAEDEDLGYLGDASVKDYATTIKRVLKKCKDPRFIIPGHGDWTDINSLKHTLKMAEELKKKNKL